MSIPGDLQPYRILRTVSADTLTDVSGDDASFHPFFSTYGNPENSYKASPKGLGVSTLSGLDFKRNFT